MTGDQIRRLESAMVTRRRWTAGEFRRLFVDHPLIWHLARRLVWVAEDDAKATPFRVAEDRTFADAGDDTLTLPEHTGIGIAHPLELDAALGAWTTAATSAWRRSGSTTAPPTTAGRRAQDGPSASSTRSRPRNCSPNWPRWRPDRRMRLLRRAHAG